MMKNKKRKKHKNKLFFRNSVLVAIVICLVFAVGAVAGISAALDEEKFAAGIYIDGADVSGMTYENALALANQNVQDKMSKVRLSVNYSDEETVYTASDLGLSSDVEKVVADAFAFNKALDDSVEDRFNKTLEASAGKVYTTSFTVDRNVLKKTIEKFAEEHCLAAIDATASFNKDTASFSYTEGKDGYGIDTEEMSSIIEKKVQENDYSPITIQSKPVEPKITEAYLKENTVLLGAYETMAANSENRNINIGLMCGYIDGLVIQPGETLSINELVGQRTAEKGFKKAPAIMDGTKLIDDLGGGICQVSGTLYNVALIADMEIVERVRHSWPSNYLPVGQDSTLNWDDKDLKIKNRSDMPIYISAKFKDQVVRVELYGKPLADNVTVDVENEIIEEIKPPASDIVYTNQLPVGETQVQVTPRTGYHVKVYRNYMKDGKIIESELISEDNYPAIKGIILQGSTAQEK